MASRSAREVAYETIRSRIITMDLKPGDELNDRELAEELGIRCYDHELIELIAKEHGFDERYVANISEKCIEAAYPMTIGHRFAMPPVQIMDQGYQVAAAQQQNNEKFSNQGACVIVGRCADVILKDYHPLNLFVYADAESKIQRCIDRAPEGEHLSRNDIARRMKQVDKYRAQYRQMFADNKWGAKETYHLCVNTSGHEIKDLIPGLAAFVRCWFGEKLIVSDKNPSGVSRRDFSRLFHHLIKAS